MSLTDDLRDPDRAVDEARRLFDYADGQLVRKVTTSPRAVAGRVAGTINAGGYVQVRMLGRLWFVHRLVFAMHHGWMPDEIDHIDGNRANNRIENLRPATRAQNNYNAKRRSNNKSGLKGVSWSDTTGKWRVRIGRQGKTLTVGYFDNFDDAANARSEAEQAVCRKYRRQP